MEFSELHKKLSCAITPGSVSLFNCEIYQRGRVSRVADTELVLLSYTSIRPQGSIPGVDELGAIILRGTLSERYLKYIKIYM